ncbi:general substrate transporter [Penicillium cataractarum]|uniref:General substrate transporter n=1 Tax=Penicillium cataractarum TaxID=2100454 RepID=A0A9W9S621_9EURO|nr:general substrate transporter [Penicillium cataractarum]KAJ5370273.1 general substrate transporter [Penicillium cataractarum]
MKPRLSEHLHAQKRIRSNAEDQCHPDDGPQALELEHVEQTPFYTPLYSRKYVWTCVLSASIGGILFGYDTGVISSALVLFHSDLGHPLDNSEKQLLTSLTGGGAFVGALLAALVTDAVGRKMVIGIGCIWFTVGSVVAASAYSVLLMGIARFIIGVGIGFETMVTPIYIAELSPSSLRGRMITVYSMAVTGGQALAYAGGTAFSHVELGWRYLFALGALPALAQVALFPVYPETPRHLIYRGRIEDSVVVLQQLYPRSPPSDIQRLGHIIREDVNCSVSFDQGVRRLMWSWKQLWLVPSNRRSLISACGLMAVQQLCGFNILMYYSGTLFAAIGLTNPIAASLIVSGTNFFFTIVALFFVDLGRRRMLVWTIWGLPIALAMAAVAFSHIPLNSALELEGEAPSWTKALALASLSIFVSFYAIALGNIPWTANELLALEVRAIGTSLLTMVCWGCNIIVSATFLSLVGSVTATGAFGLYAGLCFAGWLLVIFTYPETAGMGLESIREVFKDGFGIRFANQTQRTRRHGSHSRM